MSEDPNVVLISESGEMSSGSVITTNLNEGENVGTSEQPTLAIGPGSVQRSIESRSSLIIYDILEEPIE